MWEAVSDCRLRWWRLSANPGRSSRRLRQTGKNLSSEPLEVRALLHASSVLSGTVDSGVAQPDQPAASLPAASVSGGPIVAAPITPQALLPDLTPWASQSRGFMYDWTVQGNELRLTTSMANVGTGRLELRGGAVHGNTQDVYQRIYEPNGTYSDVLAGSFLYHPGHGHIHFNGFAQYRLREVTPGGGVGNIIASGAKVSFCLLDVERYNTSGPSTPQFLNCGQVQGISPGWADVYDRGLPDQSINITGVPNGTYWLEVVVDPDNLLIEADDTNNVQRIQITLNRGTGGGGENPADAFEPNNSFAAASILAPPEDHTYSGLSVNTGSDNDYYRVTASASGTLTFRLAFQNAQGDIDMEVLSASQAVLGRSQSTGNSEQVSVPAVAGQYYYVRVYGYRGATNPTYTLTVDQPADGSSDGDMFEQNDSFSAARALPPADQTFTSLSIDAAADDDYYQVVPPVSGTLTVSTSFVNSQGDLDLDVYDAAQTRLGRSESSANAEQLSLPVTAGQSYYIRVFGYNGAVNPNYSLTIDVPAPLPPAAPGSFYLSTTSAGTLAGSNGTGSVSFSDADILQLTVQSDGQYQYQLHFDGSDVGLASSSEDIDAFTFLPDGSILISTTGAFSVPASTGGTLTGTGSDILRFVPGALGPTTTGQWSLYFDGSDVGLTTSAENIDAVSLLSDGRLLISTTGAFTVSGVSGQDEDLLAFRPGTLGPVTSGTWSLYFDGSDVGLATTASEDIDALFVQETGGQPTLHFSTLGVFSVTGVAGTDEDLVAFVPTSLGASTAGSFGPGLALDGSRYGLAAYNIDGIYQAMLPAPVVAPLAGAAATGPAAGAPTAGVATPRSAQRVTTGARDDMVAGSSLFEAQAQLQAPWPVAAAERPAADFEWSDAFPETADDARPGTRAATAGFLTRLRRRLSRR